MSIISHTGNIVFCYTLKILVYCTQLHSQNIKYTPVDPSNIWLGGNVDMHKFSWSRIPWRIKNYFNPSWAQHVCRIRQRTDRRLFNNAGQFLRPQQEQIKHPKKTIGIPYRRFRSNAQPNTRQYTPLDRGVWSAKCKAANMHMNAHTYVHTHTHTHN